LRHVPSHQLAASPTAKDQDFELFWLRHPLSPWLGRRLKCH
jgi:hypothetical protein